MKKVLLITILTALAGCSTKEPVTINAADVAYGSEGNTVGETLDTLGKATGNIPHTHKASDFPWFDSEAVAAMGVKTDVNPLKHDRYTNQEAMTAMGGKGDTNPLNHNRYTNQEAVAAMGVQANGNPLHHNRYGEADLKVSSTIQTLQAADTSLDTRVTKLEGGSTTPTGSDCPPGYKATKITATWPQWTWTFCQKGSDILIKIGDFWIDRFETVISMKTDCTNPYITTYTNFNTNLYYACSVDSFTEKPASLTYYQAQQACMNSGKHLCTNAEWQAAATGEANGKYNIGNQWPLLAVGHGSHSKITGTYNMVGNAHEWVAGLVLDGTSTSAKGLLRGGSYNSNGAGEDYILAANPTETHGARCCISGAGR